MVCAKSKIMSLLKNGTPSGFLKLRGQLASSLLRITWWWHSNRHENFCQMPCKYSFSWTPAYGELRFEGRRESIREIWKNMEGRRERRHGRMTSMHKQHGFPIHPSPMWTGCGENGHKVTRVTSRYYSCFSCGQRQLNQAGSLSYRKYGFSLFDFIFPGLSSVPLDLVCFDIGYI